MLDQKYNEYTGLIQAKATETMDNVKAQAKVEAQKILDEAYSEADAIISQSGEEAAAGGEEENMQIHHQIKMKQKEHEHEHAPRDLPLG